jgi:hypothetical protein
MMCTIITSAVAMANGAGLSHPLNRSSAPCAQAARSRTPGQQAHGKGNAAYSYAGAGWGGGCSCSAVGYLASCGQPLPSTGLRLALKHSAGVALVLGFSNISKFRLTRVATPVLCRAELRTQEAPLNPSSCTAYGELVKDSCSQAFCAWWMGHGGHAALRPRSHEAMRATLKPDVALCL